MWRKAYQSRVPGDSGIKSPPNHQNHSRGLVSKIKLVACIEYPLYTSPTQHVLYIQRSCIYRVHEVLVKYTTCTQYMPPIWSLKKGLLSDFGGLVVIWCQNQQERAIDSTLLNFFHHLCMLSGENANFCQNLLELRQILTLSTTGCKFEWDCTYFDQIVSKRWKIFGLFRKCAKLVLYRPSGN